MPSINGQRAWLETATTLKVPEFKPSLSDDEMTATSYIASRPGEAFCLRYDHIPVDGFDLAWKLTITGEDGNKTVEQWGGPPLEMRTSKGIVKVRAMRISDDGTTFRAFAWTDDIMNEAALSGTITLTLHLCHFAEATCDVPASTAQASHSDEKDGSEKLSHPILAPPTTKSQPSKIWTWYWRDENPQLTFSFKYSTKEKLQAVGIIPYTGNTALTNSIGVPFNKPSYSLVHSQVNQQKDVNFQSPLQSPNMHKRFVSNGDIMDRHSPADYIKLKQKMSIWRQRGLSTSSDMSDMSSSSSSDGGDEPGSQSLMYDGM